MRVKGGVLLGVALITMPLLATAQQKKPAKPEGVKLAATIHPSEGFVDDVYTFDGPGGRLALVRSDGSALAEVQVLDIAQGGALLAKFDASAQVGTVTRLAFAGGGGNLLVVGRAAGEEETVRGFLFDASGKVLRKWGPATDISYAEVEGVEVAAVYKVKPGKKGGTDYEVTVHRLDNGKVMGKKRVLKADAEGFIKQLEMKVLYWRNGYTQLVGQKKGGYDSYEDQRGHDTAAVYDVVAGIVVKAIPIGDLIEYTKVAKLRADRHNQTTFLVVAENLRGLEHITADDQRVGFTTAEPFSHYDTKTLQQEIAHDGKIYFTLTIDPVNPDAVARKIADPELIDLYVWDPASAKATRLARLPKGDRPFAWHVAGSTWAVLRKHKGFDRGGPDLELYQLTAP